MKIMIVAVIGILLWGNVSCSVIGKMFKHSSPKIVFREEKYDFGIKPRDMIVQHTFQVFNAGNDTLIITKVETACGCTMAMLTSDHIAPGDSGRLLVSLNLSDRVGRMSKTMTVYSNDPESPEKHITVSVEIEKGVHHGTMRSPKNLVDIFSGECATCHRDNGIGKMERELFDVDCAMCHGAPRFHVDAASEMASSGDKSTAKSAAPSHDKPGPLLTNKSLALLGVSSIRDIIANGKQGTTMPAFGQSKGGPLSDEQLESLVRFLAKSSGMNYP